MEQVRGLVRELLLRHPREVAETSEISADQVIEAIDTVRSTRPAPAAGVHGSSLMRDAMDAMDAELGHGGQRGVAEDVRVLRELFHAVQDESGTAGPASTLLRVLGVPLP